MFSRLYKSARAIFTDPAATENEQLTPIVEPLQDETMVTTRQKNTQAPAGDEIEEEDSINVYVSRSSSKRQRKRTKGTSSSDEDAAEYVPPSSRKRKRLPVRAKDVVESPDPGKTRPVVEIPVRKISPEPDHNDIVAAEEEDDDDTKLQDEEHDTVAAEPLESSKHRRFGSQPAEDEIFSTAREVTNDEDKAKTVEDFQVIEDSEDSDDDAPEAVGIQEAAENVRTKDREAARVVKDQLSASRKKRKEKDDVLKRQAASSRKRKLEDDITDDTKKAKRSAKEAKPISTKADQGLDEDEIHGVAEEAEILKDTFKALPLSRKRALPDLLPAEYLEDTEPQDLLPFDQFPTKKAKKTKFHLTTEKEPKDRRVGSTTYRVTKASSANLAPKSISQARNTKESWLQGRSGKKGSMNRPSFAKGFFKK